MEIPADGLSVASAIKEIRKLKSITQQDMATELGLAVRTVTYWESGTRVPPGRFLLKLHAWAQENDREDLAQVFMEAFLQPLDDTSAMLVGLDFSPRPGMSIFVATALEYLNSIDLKKYPEISERINKALSLLESALRSSGLPLPSEIPIEDEEVPLMASSRKTKENKSNPEKSNKKSIKEMIEQAQRKWPKP